VKKKTVRSWTRGRYVLTKKLNLKSGVFKSIDKYARGANSSPAAVTAAYIAGLAVWIRKFMAFASSFDSIMLPF
jgi:hypothetical protein